MACCGNGTRSSGDYGGSSGDSANNRYRVTDVLTTSTTTTLNVSLCAYDNTGASVASLPSTGRAQTEGTVSLARRHWYSSNVFLAASRMMQPVFTARYAIESNDDNTVTAVSWRPAEFNANSVVAVEDAASTVATSDGVSSLNVDSSDLNATAMERVVLYEKLTANAWSLVSNRFGYDVRSAYSYVIGCHQRVCVSTDLRVILPDNTYARIVPRFEIASRYNVHFGDCIVEDL